MELITQEKLDMPDPPKQSFFKGFFGGGVRQLDRDELFGEASGKALNNVAQVTTLTVILQDFINLNFTRENF